MRIVIATIVGGLLMFFWGFAWHVAISYSNDQLKVFKNDEPIVKAMKENITESGFYFFPGRDMSGMLSKVKEAAEEERFTAKMKEGPHGILVYTNHGDEPMSPQQLINEFISNIACALVCAVIISKMNAGFLCRTIAGAAIGIASVAAIDFSYWNWYGFPTGFLIAALIEQAVGFLLIGLACAAILKRPAAVCP
ncbi:MAG: hypothetical protein HY286_19580 [Planctomycetes bacterium]|nr:hypothetical protein [Planctomycetota bacterium]